MTDCKSEDEGSTPSGASTKQICDGWSRFEHTTHDGIIRNIIDGCSTCYGANCGDSGDAISLCPSCQEEFLEDHFRFKEEKPYISQRTFPLGQDQLVRLYAMNWHEPETREAWYREHDKKL